MRVSCNSSRSLERVNQPSNVMVSVLHESRERFHLAGQDPFHLGGKAVPGGNLRRAFGKLAVLRDDAELFLTGEDLFAQLVPPLIELAFIFVDPLLAHLMRGVRSSRSEISEK